MNEQTVHFLLIATYTLLGVGLLMILVSTILQIIRDWKGALRGIVGAGVLLVLMGLAYILEPASQPAVLVQEALHASFLASEQESAVQVVRCAGAILQGTYMLAGLTVLSLIFSEVYRWIRG